MWGLITPRGFESRPLRQEPVSRRLTQTPDATKSPVDRGFWCLAVSQRPLTDRASWGTIWGTYSQSLNRADQKSPRMPLTDATCKNAHCPDGKARERYADSGGLYL